MRKLLLMMLLVLSLSVPAQAMELQPPRVPASGAEQMPENTESFADGLLSLLRSGIKVIHPELEDALQVCACVFAAVLLFSVLSVLSDGTKQVVSLVSVAAVSGVLFQSSNSMIRLASQAIGEIYEYGKLLCPVMASALAAQGGVTASSALYTGTVLFSTVLNSLLAAWLIPMVYLFLVFSVSGRAVEEEILRKLADLVKGLVTWLLKTLMIVFTTYMSLTGVISGTTDAAAMKAAKMTISTAVPVVGGILSDATESVLVSIRLMKNAAGIYGILAVLAVFLTPFLKVGIHYLLWKLTGALCGIFGSKPLSGVIEDFSTALGLLLAMIGSGTLLVLISTVCFLKGAG